MATIFDSFSQLVDVNWLQQQTVLVFGCGRVGLKVILRLAQAGIGKVIIVDPDLVEIRNVGYGYPFAGIGRAKVTELRRMLKAANPYIVCKSVRRRVRLRNLAMFDEFIEEASCVVILIDSFVIGATLVRRVYRWKPCVAAVELGGVEVGDIAFSYPERTPCLDCSMRLRRRVAGHGGQSRPDSIDLLAAITAKYILALCLRDDEGRKYRGYEHYGHFLDPARCRGFVYNGPNDFLPQARNDLPFYCHLVEVATADRRPGCAVCRGYTLEPF